MVKGSKASQFVGQVGPSELSLHMFARNLGDGEDGRGRADQPSRVGDTEANHLSPDGTTAWVADFASNSVLAVNLISKQLVASIAVGSGNTSGNTPNPLAIAITNDGSKLYVADAAGGQVFVIDASSLSVVKTIPVGAFPTALRFSPDGTELWIAVTGGAQAIDPTTDAAIATIQLPFPLSGAGITGVAFHPSGQWVYLAPGGAAGKGVGPVVIDRIGKQLQKILTTGEQSEDVAVTADGSAGFTANTDGTTTVLNTNGNSVNGL